MQIDGIVFDLDGTVYLGDHALPSAVDTIATLRQRGKKMVFVSNKPLEPASAYAQKLTGLGIPTTVEDIITSGRILAEYLELTHPEQRLYVVGEQNLKDELRAHGLTVQEEFDQDPLQVIDPDGVDAVVVAFDRTLDYRKLNTAYQALVRGAHFYATNSDKACPMPGGSIPDAGATIAALEHLTGRKLELLAGKPSRLMMETAMRHMGLPARRCLLVGDRLETDIRMGQEAGMFTAVTLTGVTTIKDVTLMIRPPEFVIKNIGELLNIID